MIIEMAGAWYALQEVYGFVKDGTEVIEVTRHGYTAVKDIKAHFRINEGDSKLVDFE